MLAFILLALMPVAVTGVIPGKQCGGVICLDNSDVTCLANLNTCKCKDGMVGNGRFGCVDASSSCICYLYGDPHVTAFSQSVASAPLPCHHVLTELVTPNGITVKVTARASSRNDRPYPGFVFEDGLHFTASKGDTSAKALFARDGFWDKGLKVPLPFSTKFPEFGMYCYADASQYWTLSLPGQGVVVRYRSADSSVTIQAPKGSRFLGNTLCGDCRDDSNKYLWLSMTSGLKLKEWSLMKTILNLDLEREDDAQCKRLNTVFNGCSQEKRQKAVKFCGAPFSHNDIGECFAEMYGKKAVLSKMNECIDAFCSGNMAQWCSTTNTVKAQCSKTIDFSVILNICGYVV